MVQNHGPGVIYQNKFKDEDRNIVFLNLQTGGLTMKSDILQIGLRCGKKTLDLYIRPSKPIHPEATRLHGLSNGPGRALYLKGKEVQTVSMTKSVNEVLKFIEELGGPCIFVAHQASFHIKRLKRLIKICHSFFKFVDVIDGFVDTLSMFHQKFPTKREQGQHTLEGLAKRLLQFPVLHHYNASYNTFLLEQLVYKYVDYNELINKLEDW